MAGGCVRFGILIILCIAQCISIKYEYGKAYKYTYDTDILFNDHYSKKTTKPQGDVGFHIRIEFDLSPIFEGGDTQLIKIQATSAKLSSFHRAGVEAQLIDIPLLPMFFEYSNGVVGKVYQVDKDSVFCSNIKKGIISLFQVQTEEGERTEIDVSGECKVKYSISGPTIIKNKITCNNVEIAKEYENENQVLGVSAGSSSTWTYQMENGIIDKVMGSSRHIAALNIRSSFNGAVVAVQKMSLLSNEPSTDEKLPGKTLDEILFIIRKGSGHGLIEMLLPSGTEVRSCTEGCEKPQTILSRIKDSLLPEKLATLESAQAFIQLLRAFRNSGKNTIAEVLTSKDSYYIVPQLIDVAVATQSQSAHRALMELLNFEETSYIEYPLRFLLSAAYSTHPGNYLLKDLNNLIKKKLPNKSLREAAVLALGAVVHAYCRDPHRCREDVVTDYKKTVLEKLQKCGSSAEDNCKQMYIISMGNAGLPEFLPTLLDMAVQSETAMSAYTALNSLRRIPNYHFTEKEKRILLQIFHQTNKVYDSSVRAAAAEVLLRTTPSKDIVENLIISCMANQEQFELSTFVLRKLTDMAKSDPKLGEIMNRILQDSTINNYHYMAQRGKSSAFSSLLAETQEVNSTYGLYMETSKTGVMKKSSMMVDLLAKLAKQPFLNFGIYAAGLETILGDEPEPGEGEEEVEATAGLALTLLDVILPPVEFFRGSGGLMSAVWNAPSEPISALQFSFLLQDHSQYFHLANGLVVELQVMGVTSIDLTGSVSISLWNRNSKSLIRNSGSLVVDGALKLDTEIGQLGMSFTAEGEAFIDFLTDVDFYETPFKMCMQMMRPDIKFKHTINKYERAKKFPKSYRSKIQSTTKVPGVSFFLNQKNSEECKVLVIE